jgi:hypothetical protein
MQLLLNYGAEPYRSAASMKRRLRINCWFNDFIVAPRGQRRLSAGYVKLCKTRDFGMPCPFLGDRLPQPFEGDAP